MGSSTSTPVPLTDKSSYSARPRDPSAADWLAALSLRSTGKATAAVSTSSLKDWETAVESDPTHRLAAVLLHKADFTQALVSRKTVVADTQGAAGSTEMWRELTQRCAVFNVKLSSESTTVSNQKSSGRCWLVRRIQVRKTIDVDNAASCSLRRPTSFVWRWPASTAWKALSSVK